MKEQVQSALKELFSSPSMFTFAVMEKMLWKYHKAVAIQLEIPTQVGQWFRTLCNQDIKFELQRDAIATLIEVAKTPTTNEEMAEYLDSEHIKPLADLLALMSLDEPKQETI